MPRQRSKRISEGRKAALEPVPTAEDERDSNDGHNESDYISEEDEDEKALARMVLGDGAGFKSEIGKEIDASDDLDSKMEDAAVSEAAEDVEGLEGVDDADLFFLDDEPSAVDATALIHVQISDDGGERGNGAPVWDDSDDDRLRISLAGNTRLRKLRVSEAEDVITGKEYTKRLRQQFQRLNPPPEWAIPSEPPPKRRRRSSATSSSSISSNDIDVDEDGLSALPLARLLQTANSTTGTDTTKRTKLRAEVLDIQRTRDIPTPQPSAITSLSFHPQYPVILSSGPASTIYLHHVSPTSLPTPNRLLTSVHIRSTPLHTTAFLPPTGDKILFSGRRRYFHTWDLESGVIQKITRVYGHKDEQKSMERFKLSPCGRYMGLVGSSRKGGGIINILDANTTQWIASARIEGIGGIADFAWWRDGEGITIAGKGGEVGEWSMKTYSFIALWNDEGSVGTTVLSLGGRTGGTELGGHRWVAIGSSSGVVNIYDRRSWVEKGVNIPARPDPTKRFMHLTTPTSCLEFSADGQLLVIASRWKRDALRLVHLPSCTVYRNWPTSQTPFGRISAVAFSSESNMLAVGNEQGKIRLWDIRT